jgi:hypothetical protein
MLARLLAFGVLPRVAELAGPCTARGDVCAPTVEEIDLAPELLKARGLSLST